TPPSVPAPEVTSDRVPLPTRVRLAAVSVVVPVVFRLTETVLLLSNVMAPTVSDVPAALFWPSSSRVAPLRAMATLSAQRLLLLPAAGPWRGWVWSRGGVRRGGGGTAWLLAVPAALTNEPLAPAVVRVP